MAADLPQSFPSILSHSPQINTSTTPPHPTPVWRYNTHTSFPTHPPKLHANELLIKIRATGICHTDVFLSSIPHGAVPGQAPYPKVMGHEGAGIVLAVGDAVIEAAVGDSVLLSYDYCGDCGSCKSAAGGGCECDEFSARNTANVEGVYVTEDEKGEKVKVGGKFFGQSSFAAYALVEEKSVVNVTKLIRGEEELKVLAPLGCGLMTGVGAMMNVAKLHEGSVVLVLGAGAVGMGAVMAARNSGVKGVIVVDRVGHRLATAKELGASETVDTTGMDMAEVPKKIMELAAKISGGNPMAIDYAFETTGNARVTEAGMAAMGMRGLMIAVGIPPLTATFTFSAADLYYMKKRYIQNILGNSDSRVVLPQMIKWWREGRFEIETLNRYFKAEKAEEALEGMESGAVIKPVLVW